MLNLIILNYIKQYIIKINSDAMLEAKDSFVTGPLCDCVQQYWTMELRKLLNYICRLL